MRNLPRRYMLHLFSFMQPSASGEISQLKVLGRFGKGTWSIVAQLPTLACVLCWDHCLYQSIALGGAFHGLYSTSAFRTFPRNQKFELQRWRIVQDAYKISLHVSPVLWIRYPGRQLFWIREVCVQHKMPVPVASQHLQLLEFLPAIWELDVGMLWSWDQLRGSSQISTRSSHTIGGQNSELYGCLNLLSFFGTFVLKISSATMLLVGHPCKSKPRANTKSEGRFKSYWHVLNLGSLQIWSPKNIFWSGNPWLLDAFNVFSGALELSSDASTLNCTGPRWPPAQTIRGEQTTYKRWSTSGPGHQSSACC